MIQFLSLAYFLSFELIAFDFGFIFIISSYWSNLMQFNFSLVYFLLFEIIAFNFGFILIISSY